MSWLDPRQQWVTIATGITPCLGQTPIGYPEDIVPIKVRADLTRTRAPAHAGSHDTQEGRTEKERLSGFLSSSQHGNDSETIPDSQPVSASNNAPARVRTRNIRVRDLYSTQAGARETGRCALEDTLTDESIAKMAGSFTKINPLLDETWLREAIRSLHGEFGAVPEAHLRRAIRATFDYCARRLPIGYGAKGHVGFPRAFATHVLKSEIKRTPPH